MRFTDKLMLFDRLSLFIIGVVRGNPHIIFFSYIEDYFINQDGELLIFGSFKTHSNSEILIIGGIDSNGKEV